MAGVVQNQEGVPENLTKQLAVPVRGIRWSYTIFWSSSTTQPGLFACFFIQIPCIYLEKNIVWSTFFGVIEWGDGYYNGDIKTRKTVPAMELKADKIGLERSQQLRELYESLLEGETEQVNKRPSAAFSPEDLTDAE
ncbi:hypothetical protein ACOSP7_023477 [Xanthoceras sorbifolium]